MTSKLRRWNKFNPATSTEKDPGLEKWKGKIVGVYDLVKTAAVDQQACQELYDRFYKKLFDQVNFKVDDEFFVEDIVNKIFLRIIEKGGTLYDKPEESQPEKDRRAWAWIAKIRTNLIFTYYSSKIPKNEVSFSDLVKQDQSHDDLANYISELSDLMIYQRDYQEVWEDITSRLNPKETSVLKLRLGPNNLTYEEIGEKLNCSGAWAWQIMQRILQKLSSFSPK